MKIEIQTIPYECRQSHSYGTILYGSSFLEYLENAQQWYNTHKAGKTVLSLAYLKDSRISAVRECSTEFLNAEDFLFDLRYQCPYSDNLYYWALPHSIITEDPSVYMKSDSFLFDMATDNSWNVTGNCATIFDESGNLQLNRVDKSILGSSYTLGTLSSDGSASRVSYMTPLSNGDILLSSGWMWHNK